ncbi:MAG: hypothetical protein ACK4OI_02075, partial [Rhizobium oryzihabitans]
GIGENDFLNVFRECHNDVHLHEDGIETPPFPWDFGTFTVQPQNCEAIFRKDARQNIEWREWPNASDRLFMTGTKGLSHALWNFAL